MFKARINTLTIADGVNVTIKKSDYVPMYIVTGSPTLTGGWSLSLTGIPEQGDVCIFFWRGQPNFNGQTVRVFGQAVPAEMSGKEFVLLAVYSNSTWDLTVMPDMLQTGGAEGISGGGVALTGLVVNADISPSAAIAYSKLDLAAAILNADISPGAAIAYSKLNLAGSIVDADIDAAAAIDYTKLDLAAAIVNSDIDPSAAIAYSKLNLAGSILNADINASAAIDFSKMAALTANKALATDAAGKIVAVAAVSDTILGYLANVTSDIQTQINSKTEATLSEGNMFVGSGASEVAPIDAKGSGKILIGNGTTVASQSMSGDGSLSSAGVFTIGANAATPSKVGSSVRKDLVTVQVSFETSEQGRVELRVPYKANLTHIFASVSKAIAATDDGSINFKDNAGNNIVGSTLTSGSLAITLSSAIGTSFSSTATGNNSFVAGDVIQIQTSKSTAGGKVILSLEFEKQD